MQGNKNNKAYTDINDTIKDLYIKSLESQMKILKERLKLYEKDYPIMFDGNGN